MKKNHPKPEPIAASFTTAGYIVLKEGLPCTLANVSGLHKGGVLLPHSAGSGQAGAPVAMFLKLRDARRAIARTTRCVERLRGSMIEEWARKSVPLLFIDGNYDAVALGRQG
ncbi:MAG: hypothetical protein HZA93_29265 [Verrucomicrobia bacterium]|nr:hypothetical protein [Verrucomicrobiota bacterium]